MKKAIFSTALFALLLLCSGVARGQNDTLPDIFIGGVAIFETNDSISGENISGKASYDAETQTLTLDNVTVSGSIDIWRKHIRITLLGENTIQSLFIAPDSCTVVGPGILNIGTATLSIAVDAGRTAYLGLKQQAVLNITASEVGISCMYDYIGDVNPIYPVFDIDNSALSISAPTCYYLIPWWRLESSHLAVPSDVNYDSETLMFSQDGEILYSIHDYMEIRPGTVGVREDRKIEWHAWGMDGRIRIDGLGEGQVVEVVNLNGQQEYLEIATTSNIIIPLVKGIHIVRIGGMAVKTIVK
ncbi:MAG: hypothetical protein IKZ52_08710 [Bacteroidales bacterium]|nr:hypothetical protein [Bacteroidales bacterium]